METNREIVGVFADTAGFERAVRQLIDNKFAETDLSVLSSHESIDAAKPDSRSPRDVMVALLGEMRFEAPLVAAGAILLAGGPLAATIAAVIGAGLGGMALKEVIDEVTSTPDPEVFAAAVKAGGIILWVRVHDKKQEQQAKEILSQHGGWNVHLHETAKPPA
jgi:hypothetical protein